VVMGWLQHSCTCYQVRVSACCRVFLCQTLNVDASLGPGSVGAYPILKAPGCGFRESGYVLSRGDEVGWADRHHVCHVYRGGVSAGVDYARV
jgi:hypothetical protein